MTEREHHLLTLGLLAKIYIQAQSQNDPTAILRNDLDAIHQAVESAEKLGLPVSVKRLRKLQPIATDAMN